MYYVNMTAMIKENNRLREIELAREKLKKETHTIIVDICSILNKAKIQQHSMRDQYDDMILSIQKFENNIKRNNLFQFD